jgi:histone H3/H4
MPTRNTPVLERIVKALGDTAPSDALARLEQEFESSLLVVAGNTNDVARHAEQLRLAITTEECALVLDHLAPQIRISLDQAEEAINALFPDRFIEP